MLLRRKAMQSEMSRKLQNSRLEFVEENTAATMMQQAVTSSLREEQRFRSTSSRREAVRCENAEVQSNQDWLQAETQPDSLLVKLQEAKKIEQARQEYLNRLAADEVTLKRQVRQQMDANSACRTHMQWDNEALIDLKRRKEKIAQHLDRKFEEEMRAREEEALWQEKERIHQRKLKNLSVAEYLKRQMDEKKLLKERETMQDQRAEHRARMNRLENEKKQQQRKMEQIERFRKLQNPKEIVRENLAALKREQAITTCLRDEQRLNSAVAKQEAEMEKRQRDKEEKRAAVLMSISAHREETIKERAQREREELQSDQDWLEAQKEAARLFDKKEKLKTQKIREEKCHLHNFNASLAAERRAQFQRQKKEEYDAAVRNAEEIAEREIKHQQYIQRELHALQQVPILPPAETGRRALVDREVPGCIISRNGEALPKLGTAKTKLIRLRQEQNKLQLSYSEVDKGTKRLSHLPPISSAAKHNLTAQNAKREEFGPTFSRERCNYLSTDDTEPFPRYSAAQILKERRELFKRDVKYEETTITDLREAALSSRPVLPKIRWASGVSSIPKLPPI
ncbi:trichohyalin-like [Thunnus albacares]|uniref:trichohyalin-like n=1 Tax=Thunnus albacares TaxID=8236 RepID=UPI001CF63211|nr:trichohyalin-like [Thunnus albacares]XP_044187141.1 trichohyalin-like [Thunnus albacares]XP_044187142.1 trichohyalin-like [Thunnus albacares]XP_044187143.1 trichohyalin-like [Thunnus albacares]XP_044187144.1 trichohyalin-like [Thunnus albacares]XP_044187145.1 trichohyalin-like [Thunnus albacares]XP_044187146.1 trichohyalin-like [Thunnus albacares]XP_044187147.1 trichohyalin-like [Thunnus albacares]XP_044187148.1 trichohyalin-like [Thunnus albacares]XP_044187149.1 trichohyalin-like [Thun